MSRGRVVILGWADSTHIQRWAAGLAERGFRISVISVGGQPIPGIETTIYPRGDKWAYLKHALSVRQALRRDRPDLLHCHYASGFGVWTQIAQIHPTLVSVWGSDVIGVSGVERWMVRRTIRRASWVSATGLYLKKATLDLCPQCSTRLSVIPFGVQLPDSVLPLPSGPVRICFLKEHRAIYAPDILVEAFALARQKVPEMRLTLAGDGPMTEQLRSRLRQLGLSEAVDFPGYIDRSAIAQFISNHHIMAMPSRMESFGVAALEAASCARPVVATQVGGIPEVVHDGKTGILVPPENLGALADALVRLAADRALAERMGLAGRELVRESYLWDKSLDMMCDLYDRLIADAT